MEGFTVGTLQYGSAATKITFDDRILLHLQLVVGAKLQRREAFFFSWKNTVAGGSGRTSIWLESTISLSFQYDSPLYPTINRRWLDEMMASANSPHGLVLSPEPLAPTTDSQAARSASKPSTPSTRIASTSPARRKVSVLQP
jgi:hypothetical protein